MGDGIGDGSAATEVATAVNYYDDAGDGGSIGDADDGAYAQVDSTFATRSGATERVGSAPPNPETVNVRESQCLPYILSVAVLAARAEIARGMG
jgi:hypothetical protein